MTIRVKERMAKKIFSIESNKTVLDVARQMTEKRVGSMLITRDGAYKGIVTEGDFVRKVVSADLNPRNTPVSSIMTTSLITIEADASVMEANDLMQKNNIRHLAVTENGMISGVLSMRDVTRK